MGQRVFSATESKQGIAIIPNRQYRMNQRMNFKSFQTLLVEELKKMTETTDMILLEKLEVPALLEGSLFFEQIEGRSRKDVLPAVKTAIRLFHSKQILITEMKTKMPKFKSNTVRDMTDSFFDREPQPVQAA